MIVIMPWIKLDHKPQVQRTCDIEGVVACRDGVGGGGGYFTCGSFELFLLYIIDCTYII